MSDSDDVYLDYPIQYASFQKALEQCISTSRRLAGISSPTKAQFFASLLFTKLCTSAVSISKLSPNPEQIGSDIHWDYSSVFTLTRSFVECYLVFFYLCIEDCPKDEWDARWHLMNLHDHFSRLKMFGTPSDEMENSAEAATLTAEVTSALKGNLWFQQQTTKRQSHYLKGRTAFFQTKDEIVKISGGRVSEFRFMYRFLSNHTHSFPMGFYRMGDGERGRGVESRIEVKYTGIALECATDYLIKANDEYLLKFN